MNVFCVYSIFLLIMATTSRTKGNRGTSPSNSQTSTHTPRGGSRRRLASSEKEKASEKPTTPNFLKATTTSTSNEPFNNKLGKQINHSHYHEDNQKLLSRRRSFDKSPSASPRGQKALTSPSPRNRAGGGGGSAPAPSLPRERKITVRASSLGRHTVTTTKNVADPKVSKTPKAVRSPSTVSSTPTKSKSPFSSINNKKDTRHNNASAASRKSSVSRDPTTTRALDHGASNHEAKEEEEEEGKEDLIKEVEIETLEVSLDVNFLKSETEEEIDVHVVETEDEKINSRDISMCMSEDQNLIQEQRLVDQEIDDQVKGDVPQGQDGFPGEIVIEEVGNNKTLKEIEGTGEDDDDDDGGSHNKNVSGSIEDDDKVEEEKLEYGEEAASDDLINKAKEDEDGEAAAAKLVLQRVHHENKKESPSAAAYNDVIEETASKLREQKKNKVRALVGAFETVIDYESGSSK